MLDQSGHISAMAGTIPLGRGLMPEEVADFKAKGREWSRLYKEKRRKDFSLEQIEERKLKNRLTAFFAIGPFTDSTTASFSACFHAKRTFVCSHSVLVVMTSNTLH